MEVLITSEAQMKLSQARCLMSEALAILDDFDEAGDVGSHLDLAICRLDSHLDLDAPEVGGALALRDALKEELLASSAEPTECPWRLEPI